MERQTDDNPSPDSGGEASFGKVAKSPALRYASDGDSDTTGPSALRYLSCIAHTVLLLFLAGECCHSRHINCSGIGGCGAVVDDE